MGLVERRIHCELERLSSLGEPRLRGDAQDRVDIEHGDFGIMLVRRPQGLGELVIVVRALFVAAVTGLAILGAHEQRLDEAQRLLLLGLEDRLSGVQRLALARRSGSGLGTRRAPPATPPSPRAIATSLVAAQSERSPPAKCAIGFAEVEGVIEAQALVESVLDVALSKRS